MLQKSEDEEEEIKREKDEEEGEKNDTEDVAVKDHSPFSAVILLRILSRSASGIFCKASLLGTNTVNGPPEKKKKEKLFSSSSGNLRMRM